ncbi:hypothetical protein E1K64_20360 [Salmonella enterica subsp. enterica serovar Poona]|nr:hypothetical protein [Salmonella enterica subsp. enterica serovar Poona]HEB6949307.1 hypothetical protein [Salmonella enterica subsp. enterica serovar Hvittingfoss]
MKNTDIYAFSNFEFLAITFAQMARQGRAVNMDAVTGNMDDRQREWFLEWFLERYRFWLVNFIPGMPEKQTKTISPGNGFPAFATGCFRTAVLQAPDPVLMSFLMIKQNKPERLQTIQDH